MRFLAALILLGALHASHGSDESISKQVVGTWQRADGSPPRLSISADGSFLSSVVSTNHTNVLTFGGAWHVRDGELLMTLTNVSGKTFDGRTRGASHLRILELDNRHMIFVSQPAVNMVATNVFVKKP